MKVSCRTRPGWHVRLIANLIILSYRLLHQSVCGDKGSEVNSELSQTVLDAYHTYNEFSLAVESLNKEVRTHVKRQVLDILELEDEPSPNVTETRNSGADLYIQSLYRRFDVKEKGHLVVDPKNANIKLLTYRGEELVNSDIDEDLSLETQKFINHSDTIVSCTNLNPTTSNSLQFELSPSTNHMFTPKTPILGAQVRIFVNRSKGLKQPPYEVSLKTKDVEDPHESNQVIVLSRFRGWITLNVTEAVTNWIQSREQVGGPKKLLFKLLIDGSEQAIPHHYGILNSHQVTREHHPFLLIYLSTKGIRTKPASPVNLRTTIERPDHHLSLTEGLGELENYERSSQTIQAVRRPKRFLKSTTKSNSSIARVPTKNNYHQKYCSKKSMHIHFGELKWSDWIIAPDGFEAGYCDGKCPFPLPPNLNSSNHAIIQMLAHLLTTHVPEPCCAPTKHSPITVLYYDDYSNVVLKEYRNMIVQSCSCL